MNNIPDLFVFSDAVLMLVVFDDGRTEIHTPMPKTLSQLILRSVLVDLLGEPPDGLRTLVNERFGPPPRPPKHPLP